MRGSSETTQDSPEPVLAAQLGSVREVVGNPRHHFGALRYVGLLPLLTTIAAALAFWVHESGPLSGASYTWFRPFTVLREVFERRYAVTILVSGYLCGFLARPARGRLRLKRKWREVSGRESLRIGVASLLAVAADYFWFSRHGLIDHGCAALAGAGVAYPIAWNSPRRLRATMIDLSCTLLAFVLVSYFFTVVKAHLFLVRAPQDGLIVAWERELSGRTLHASIAGWSATSPDFIRFCDRIYYYLFDHMAVVSAFLSGLGQPQVRRKYVSALCVCYLLGALGYYALPALGPAFFDPQSFSYVRELGLDTQIYHSYLFRHTQAAVDGTLNLLPTYAFLAAMPSLHMAHEFVMLWYSRSSRVFGAFAAVFSALTYAAILVLGWHYASDLAGSFVLAGLSIWIVERTAVPWFPARWPDADVREVGPS